MKKIEKNKNLNELCNWLNDLDDESQLNILSYITGKVEEIQLDDNEREKFESLISNVLNLIIDGKSEETLKIILEESGLNKLFINPISVFCYKEARPYLDAKIVESFDTEELVKICEFVVNKMILYQDYLYIPYSQFSKSINVENKKLIKNVLTFLRSNYMVVCKRELSSDALINDLMVRYKFPNELCQLIIEPLKEKLFDAQQAYLLKEINAISKKISGININEDSEK